MHFDNAGKTADAVRFMDHVIPDGQVGIAFDALSARGQSAVLFFVFPADQLGVCQHRKTERRIFNARGNRTDADAAFAECRQRLCLRAERGLYAAFPQKALQHAGPALVAGQNDHAIVLLLKDLQILGGRLGISGIGGQLFGRDAEQRLRAEGAAAEGERVSGIERVVFQLLPDAVRRKAEAVRVKGASPLPLQGLQIFPQLLPVLPCHLADAGGLVGKDDGVLRNIVKARRRRIQKRQPAVQIRHFQAAADALRVRAQRRREARARHARAAPGSALGQLLQLPAHGLRAARAERRQGFLRRKHRTGADVLLPPLGRDVKGPHRVDFIAPELHTHGAAVRRGEKIQDAAASGKLPGPFHLVAAFVAAAHKRFLNLFYFGPAVCRNRKGRPVQDFGRDRPLQHRGYGGNGNARFVLFRGPAEPVQGVQPFLLHPVGRGLRRQKTVIPQNEAGNRQTQHAAQVAGKVLGRGIVRTEDKEGPLQLLKQCRRQIGPVHRREAGNKRRKLAALRQRGEGGKLLMA